MVLDSLNNAGAKSEGNLAITLQMDGHNGNTLRNLVNLIWSKQTLIQKALAQNEAILPSSFVKTINSVPIDTLEDFVSVVNNAIEAGEITGRSDLEIDLVDKNIAFSFFNATLDAEEIHAYGKALVKKWNRYIVVAFISFTFAIGHIVSMVAVGQSGIDTVFQ